MKFAIITHVSHIQEGNHYFGYSPYVREMNIWAKYVDEVIIVAPVSQSKVSAIDLAYKHLKIDFRTVPNFNFIGLKNTISSIFKLPILFWKIFYAMNKADHIHLRCPGNMGLLGCFVQLFFPNKKKTAKYAGNWDPESKQPWTYNLQKWILSNTFLTRNMQVLVYGDWENQGKNIKPFFTATYLESEKEVVKKVTFENVIEFIFVGGLVLGKNPLYAVKLVEGLIKCGKNVTLNVYGDGSEQKNLVNYIFENNLENIVILHGNQNQEVIKKAYQKSHFVILPSKSEGWPKAIAEGMFWGCVPIATRVSCVPVMLDFGNRGVLLEMNLEQDLQQVEKLLNSEESFLSMSNQSSDWSRKYTLDFFENEIKFLLYPNK